MSIQIGLDEYSISAASKAKRIGEESVVSYGACGIPYVIEGLISNFEKVE